MERVRRRTGNGTPVAAQTPAATLEQQNMTMPDLGLAPAAPTQFRLPLTAVVCTRDEADRIERCIHPLLAMCEEVIVLDSGSTDDTVTRSAVAGARVAHQDWLGFAAQKNAVIRMARTEWVLLLDADEFLDEDAARAIVELFANGRIEQADVWCLQRRTHFLGRPLRFGGWGRESVERLFRKRFRYKPAKVHESLDLSGARIANAAVRIEHDTARSAMEYRNKLAGYSRLFAEQRHLQGKRAGPLSPLLHAAFYMLKNFIVRGGFLDGPKAWDYHLAHARYVWNKYRILRSLGAAGHQTRAP